jgi:hypothetical protein
MPNARAIHNYSNSHISVDQRMLSTHTLLEHQLRQHVWQACIQIKYVGGPAPVDCFKLIVANDICKENFKLIGGEESPRTAKLSDRSIEHKA